MAVCIFSFICWGVLHFQLKKNAPMKAGGSRQEAEEVEDANILELFEELKQWKAGHEK